MIRLRNNTKETCKKGFCVVIDPQDKNSFIYAPADSQNILGIIEESVPYRSEANIITSGEALVFVNTNVKKNDIIRARKSADTIPSGATTVAREGQTPYLQVGLALQSGKGLIRVQLLFAYRFSDDDTITWDDITGKPTAFPPTDPTVRVVTDTTTELTTDNTIVCNKSTAMTVNLLGATGSGRVRTISNINLGEVTVDGNSTDVIDGDLTQKVKQYGSLSIQDYLLNKWKVI